MNLILHPCPLSGRIAAIPSKSWAHRLLLGAALSGSPTVLPLRFPFGRCGGNPRLLVSHGRFCDIPK